MFANYASYILSFVVFAFAQSVIAIPTRSASIKRGIEEELEKALLEAEKDSKSTGYAVGEGHFVDDFATELHLPDTIKVADTSKAAVKFTVSDGPADWITSKKRKAPGKASALAEKKNRFQDSKNWFRSHDHLAVLAAKPPAPVIDNPEVTTLGSTSFQPSEMLQSTVDQMLSPLEAVAESRRSESFAPVKPILAPLRAPSQLMGTFQLGASRPIPKEMYETYQPWVGDTLAPLRMPHQPWELGEVGSAKRLPQPDGGHSDGKS
ncbi:hypothetical protein FRB94_005616 [Tulasnella sp. JGI-2019a]|nr:hypothetical protein FRB94_005616 [Tulasnella sp. JGI-2019a]